MRYFCQVDKIVPPDEIHQATLAVNPGAEHTGLALFSQTDAGHRKVLATLQSESGPGRRGLGTKGHDPRDDGGGCDYRAAVSVSAHEWLGLPGVMRRAGGGGWTSPVEAADYAA